MLLLTVSKGLIIFSFALLVNVFIGSYQSYKTFLMIYILLFHLFQIRLVFVIGTCLNVSLRLGVGLCFGVGLGVGVGTEIKYCNYYFFI